VIAGRATLAVNRFFALDSWAYDAGALGTKTEEMLRVAEKAPPTTSCLRSGSWWGQHRHSPSAAGSGIGCYLRVSSTPIRISTAPPPCSGTSRSPSTAHATMAATTGVMHMYTAVRLPPTRATLEFQIR
jgi:hypothetical protein